MEKNRNKNWDGGYLYYPFLHSTTVSHYVLHVHSVQWNAGRMGITDTLHPNSCFCSFSIPTSRIKFLLLVYIIIYRGMHRTQYCGARSGSPQLTLGCKVILQSAIPTIQYPLLRNRTGFPLHRCNSLIEE